MLSKLTALAAAVALALPVTAIARRRTSPLTWKQAHAFAKGDGWNLPVPGIGAMSVKTTWCNRWSRLKIDCGIQANGTVTTRIYDPCASFDANYNCLAGYDVSTGLSSCQVTIDVHKTRYGRIWSRREADLSCFGAS